VDIPVVEDLAVDQEAAEAGHHLEEAEAPIADEAEEGVGAEAATIPSKKWSRCIRSLRVRTI
jgi:hypothetical protein